MHKAFLCLNDRTLLHVEVTKMGLFDSLPNPLDFGSKSSDSKSSDSFLPGLPSFNVDLTNPFDSLLAGKNNSSSGDRSNGSGGPLDLFGSLTLDMGNPLSMLGGGDSSKSGGRSSSPLSSLTNPFELTKSLLNKPLDIAESVIGGDPGGVLNMGRMLNNAPLNQAESLLGNPTASLGGGQGDSGSFLDQLFPGDLTDLFGGAFPSSDSSDVWAPYESWDVGTRLNDGRIGSPDDVWAPGESWDLGTRQNGDDVWSPTESWDLNTRMYDPQITAGDGTSYRPESAFTAQGFDRLSSQMLASISQTLNKILDLLEANMPGELGGGGGGRSNGTGNSGGGTRGNDGSTRGNSGGTDSCGHDHATGGNNGTDRNNDTPTPRDNTDRGGDSVVPKRDGPIVHIDSSEQLENLKIEPGMQVKLKPGAHYQIDKGLTLPEGASIVGDKNNPPSIDYVGSDKNFPNIVNVNGKDAVIEGVNFESSLAKPGAKGGASGIRVNENADNLLIKDCTAGTIASFIHIDGADNVTIDGCSAEEVNSYFVWNAKGSDGTTIKNSRCDDSRLEWVVRSYGDDLSIENSHIENKNRAGDPGKGALAIYDGENASITDSTIAGGIRLGPLSGPIHGAQYVDPENPSRLKPGLSAEEEEKARNIFSAVVDGVHAEGNRIEGWVQFSQNSKNVLFENNDIVASGSNGSFATFTAFDGDYKGMRRPAEGVLRNNRFSGDVKTALSNPSGANVRLAEGNTLNGRKI